jgi:GntR family transcriptional regulator
MRLAPFTSNIPYHHQITQVLRLRIEADAWGEGVTEQALCGEFGVSRTTVRQALSSLKREGLLDSRRGVGTRGVPTPRKAARVVRASGDPLHASVDSKPRLVSSGVVAAPLAVAEFFGLPAGAPALQVVRAHELEGKPLSVVVSYLPASLAPSLSTAELRGATHQLLWRRFGLRQKRSVHLLRVARADAAVASLLEIGLAEPVLRVQSSVYLEDGTPIRWTENFFREDRYEYCAEMEWPDPASASPAPRSRAAQPETQRARRRRTER